MNKNKFVGVHINTKGGLHLSVKKAYNLKAKAFALFIKNQRKWNCPMLTQDNIYKFRNACKKYNYSPNHILPHNSYLINLGHPTSEGIKKSRNAFIDEIQRCEQLGLNLLNCHPGNHLNKITTNKCLIRIADSINIALEKTKKVTVVIENTAGQGSSVGFRFEQIADIIHHIDNKNRIGVCIDTCHIFVSGYEIRTKKSYLNTFKQFDNIIGFKYLKGIHINNTKSKLGSKIDRHDSLNKGQIGKNTFAWIMSDKRFDNIPIILETINPDIWQKEINWLKSLYNN